MQIGKCDAGSKYSLLLRLTSFFPTDIAVDAITITYSPFVPVTSGNMSVGSFDCDVEDIASHVIQPGQQLIPFVFNAPSVGEFVPSRICIRMKCIEFVETIASDLNVLYPFFEKHVLVSVMPPKDALQQSVHVPQFTPVTQPDTMKLCFQLQPDDHLTSLQIRVSSAEIKQQTSSFTSQLEIYGPSAWNVTYPRVVASYMKNDGLFIEEMSHADEMEIIVPFVVQANVDEVAQESRVCYTIEFHLEGVLTRNQCTMDFDVSASATISSGRALLISQLSTRQIGEMVYNQYKLTNISPIPWKILPYKSSVVPIQHSTLVLCNSLPEDIILPPGDDYFIALQLKYRGGQMLPPVPDKRGAKFGYTTMLPREPQRVELFVPATVLFQYKRAVQDSGSLFNGTLFEAPVVVTKPAESSILYRINYTIETKCDASSVTTGDRIKCEYLIQGHFSDTDNNLVVPLLASFPYSNDWVIFGASKKGVLLTAQVKY